MTQLAHALPRNQSEGIEVAARVGYATKGLLYLTLGALSVHAVAVAGKVEDGEGTMAVIGRQPLGQVLLVLTVIGLLGYAFWRGIQAVKDTESVGLGLKGFFKRAGFLVSSVSHVALAIAGVQMLLGERDGGDTKRTYLAHLNSHPLGQVLLVAVGIGIVGAGIAQLIQSKTADFSQDIETERLSRRTASAAVWVGRIGLAARGVVFGIIGTSLIHATVTKSAWKEQGLEAALNEIRSSTFGSTMLFVVALGFCAYGMYQLVQSRYRRIKAPH